MARKVDINAILYPNIGNYLLSNDIRVRDLAKAIDMKPGYMSTCLYSGFDCGIHTIRKLLAATGMSFEDLLYNPSQEPVNYVYKTKSDYVKKRKWTMYWPNLELFSKEYKLSVSELSEIFGCTLKSVQNSTTSKNGLEPNISYHYIIRILEVSKQPFDYIFELPAA